MATQKARKQTKKSTAAVTKRGSTAVKKSTYTKSTSSSAKKSAVEKVSIEKRIRSKSAASLKKVDTGTLKPKKTDVRKVVATPKSKVKKAAIAQKKVATEKTVISKAAEKVITVKKISVGKPASVAQKARISFKKIAQSVAHKSAAELKKAGKKKEFTEKEMQEFREDLLNMRDRLVGQVGKLREAALRRDDEINPEEDGSDAFDRFFTLERAGSNQKNISRINEALLAIEEKRYGTCESCGCPIEKPRLKALPFAKNCITCQSEIERGRGGFSRRQFLQ